MLRLLRLVPTIVWIVGVVGGGFLLFQWFRPSLSELRSKADSLAGVYSRDTSQLAADTLVTDSVLVADSAKPATRAAVKKERASCARALTTCNEQKKNYQQQIRALTPPRLRLYAELHYGTPLAEPFLEGVVAAEAGAILRLNQNLDAEISVEKPLLNLGGKKDAGAVLKIAARKYWRLF